MSLSPGFIEHLQRILEKAVVDVRPVSGGSINIASQLVTPAHRYFLKTNSGGAAEQMFAAEAVGLRALEASGRIRIPGIIARENWQDQPYLLLEWIDEGPRPDSFWSRFGTALAEVHRTTADTFGLASDNFIGALPQSNRQNTSWVRFYHEERLLPQVRMAVEQNLLSGKDRDAFEALWKVLPELLPEESPSLIHGDLWSGNFLAAANGEPV